MSAFYQKLTPEQLEALQELQAVQTENEHSGFLPWMARKGAILGASAAGNLGDLVTLFPRLGIEREKGEIVKKLQQYGIEPDDPLYQSELAEYDKKNPLVPLLNKVPDTANLKRWIDKVTGGYTESKEDEKFSDSLFGIAGGVLGGFPGAKAIGGATRAAKGIKGLMSGEKAVTSAVSKTGQTAQTGSLFQMTKNLFTKAKNKFQIQNPANQAAASGLQVMKSTLVPFGTKLGKAFGMGAVGATASEITDAATDDPTKRALIPLIPMSLIAATLPKKYLNNALKGRHKNVAKEYSREKLSNPVEKMQKLKEVYGEISDIKTPQNAAARRILAPYEADLKRFNTLKAQQNKLDKRIAEKRAERQVEVGKASPNTEKINRLDKAIAENQRLKKEKGLTDEAIRKATYTSEYDDYIRSKDAKDVAKSIYMKDRLFGKEASKAQELVTKASKAIRNDLLKKVSSRDAGLAQRIRDLNDASYLHNYLPKWQKNVENFFKVATKGKLGIGSVSMFNRLFGYGTKAATSPLFAVFNSFNSLRKLASSKILRDESLKFFKAFAPQVAGGAVTVMNPAATRKATESVKKIKKEMDRLDKEDGRFTPVGKVSEKYFKRQK